MLHALESKGVYISTQSACSETNAKSKSVFALTNDSEIASSSIRISLSHLTTKEEIEKFIEVFDVCYKELACLR